MIQSGGGQQPVEDIAKAFGLLIKNRQQAMNEVLPGAARTRRPIAAYFST
jgi:hypothetical protein